MPARHIQVRWRGRLSAGLRSARHSSGGVSLIFPGLLKLLDVVLVGGALGAPVSVVGGPGLVIPAPVALADDPGQDVHFVVELRRELRADEVGRARPFAPGDELHVVAVAAVLGSQRGALQGQHGADAIPGCGFVDVQLLPGPAGVLPAEVLALDAVEDVRCAVGHLRGVGAGATGQVVDHLVHVLLEELALAAHPALTAVRV